MTGDLSWIGIWLLVVGFAALVVEAAIAMLWTVRFARRASTLNARLAAQQVELQTDLARLSALLAETQLLWQPYERVFRWLRHPLVIALMQSFARRRAAR